MESFFSNCEFCLSVCTSIFKRIVRLCFYLECLILYINRSILTSSTNKRKAFFKFVFENFTRIDWCAFHSTKVRLAMFIWSNCRALCGMPVDSGEIFISFPLGKCASWIICGNALHCLKGLEMGFHPRFLFFSIMIII